LLYAAFLSAIEKWPLSWNISSNLWFSLVFLYSSSLYASLFLESLSLAYNEAHLYSFKSANIRTSFEQWFSVVSLRVTLRLLTNLNLYCIANLCYMLCYVMLNMQLISTRLTFIKKIKIKIPFRLSFIFSYTLNLCIVTIF